MEGGAMSQRQGEAFYVGGIGSDPERFRQGWDWLIETAEANESQIAYLVLSKMNQVAEVVADVIGEADAKALSNGDPIRLPSGTQLLAYSDRTLVRFDRGPVLMAYCPPKTMAKVDLAARGQPIALIPLLEKEGRQWITKHQARRIGEESDEVEV
jgi:hypothetical protein